MKENERTLKKNRVYEIYGIPKEERKNYQIHHIVFKEDKRHNPQLWKGFDIDKIANLYPLKKEEHKRLHDIINHEPRSH